MKKVGRLFRLRRLARRIALVVALIIGALIGVLHLRPHPSPPEYLALIHSTNLNCLAVREASGSYRLAWEWPPTATGLIVRTHVDTHEHSAVLRRINDTSVTSCELGVDATGCTCFLLEFVQGASVISRATVAPRFLDLHGAINVRDVGGYRTLNGRSIKWCKIYRSGDLSALSKTDANKLTALGIQDVYDLRYEEEVEQMTERLPLSVRLHRTPIHDKDERPGGFWRTLTRQDVEGHWNKYNSEVLAIRCASTIGQLLREIANEEDRPFLIHCTAGKDRTGIVVAALLLVLGVPEDTVLDDYTLSNRFFPEILDYAQQQFDAHPITTKLLNMEAIDLYPFFLARREVMEGSLRAIREHYGSYENYFRQGLDLDQATIDTLRSRYTE